MLERYGRQGQEWLYHINVDGHEYFSNAVVHAMGYEAARHIGLQHYPGRDEVLLLTESDAVLLWARRQRGEDVDTTRPDLRRSQPRIKSTISDQPPEPVEVEDDGSWRYELPGTA